MIGLCDKLESAMVVVLQPAIGVGVTVATGKTNETKTAQMVKCYAETTEEEDPPYSGNYHSDCAVDVSYPSGTGLADDGGPNSPTHDELSASLKTEDINLLELVQSTLLASDLAGLLSAAVPDLTVFPGSIVFGRQDRGRDAIGRWGDTMHFTCYACGATLTP